MSILIDDLRDVAQNQGWRVCDDAADEILDLEKSEEILSKQNFKLRTLVELIFASTLPYNNGQPTFSDKVIDMWKEISPSNNCAEGEGK